MEKPIVILGAGGHAKVLFDICRVTGKEVRGFLDGGVAGPVHGLPVLGDDAMLEDAGFLSAHIFALGVGERSIHKRLALAVSSKGGSLATLVHPAAVVAEGTSIGDGTVIMAGAVINIDACLGAHCIVNTRASIDHDCVLGDGVQICPGATLAGSVRCEDDVFIGSGATILPSITIGARTYVSGGATVNKDLPPDRKVVGHSFRYAQGSPN